MVLKNCKWAEVKIRTFIVVSLKRGICLTLKGQSRHTPTKRSLCFLVFVEFDRLVFVDTCTDRDSTADNDVLFKIRKIIDLR